MSNDQPIFGRGAATSPSQKPIVPQTAQPAPTEPAERPQRAKASKDRSKGARNIFVVFGHFVMSVLLFGMIAAGAAAYWGQSRFVEAGPLREDIIFEVPQATSLATISNRLFTQGVISDDRIFRLGVQASGKGNAMKAGEFAIPAGASMRDVMDIIVSGRSIEYAITIPEGWTVDQAWARIAAYPELVGDMPAEKTKEGWLLADTWTFPRGTSREMVVRELEKRQQALVESIWAKRAPDLPISTIEEFVTLASIVEKETGVAAERPRVASVFVNRLRQGMRLQSDPTIIYGLFGGAGKPSDRPIYKSDIEKPTPYNTYTIDGLPPTPIANPGRASLEAVANPLQTKDLFFVADGTGGHAFAETLDEHNANVRRWRQVEAERAAKAAEQASEPAANN